jgi:ComF family protein
MDLERLLDLLLPSTCSLCQKPPSMLCKDCQAQINPTLHRVERFGLKGFAGTTFDDQVSSLMTAFKEQNRRALANHFARLMVQAELVTYLEQIGGLSASDPIWLVAAPSSAKSLRKRGYVPAHELAKALQRQLSESSQGSIQLRTVEGLRLVRTAADQAGLQATERKNNLQNSMIASAWLSGKRVVIVDDIATTGSTIAECHRALSDCGAKVLGFIVFSETLLKSQAGTEKKV